MPRFAVLLRGVNVGRGNRLPMADFRAALESLGYSGVKTLLNSGNAVFTASGRPTAAHAEAIGGALKARCGLEPLVIVKSAAEFGAVVAADPKVGAQRHRIAAVAASSVLAVGVAMMGHELAHVGGLCHAAERQIRESVRTVLTLKRYNASVCSWRLPRSELPSTSIRSCTAHCV